jgi:hypothetical protein
MMRDRGSGGVAQWSSQHTLDFDIVGRFESRQEPILRFLNLQLQRQRCSRLVSLQIGEKYFFIYKSAMLLTAL